VAEERWLVLGIMQVMASQKQLEAKYKQAQLTAVRSLCSPRGWLKQQEVKCSRRDP
jgi:hypothetical protein